MAGITGDGGRRGENTGEVPLSEGVAEWPAFAVDAALLLTSGPKKKRLVHPCDLRRRRLGLARPATSVWVRLASRFTKACSLARSFAQPVCFAVRGERNTRSLLLWPFIHTFTLWPSQETMTPTASRHDIEHVWSRRLG